MAGKRTRTRLKLIWLAFVLTKAAMAPGACVHTVAAHGVGVRFPAP